MIAISNFVLSKSEKMSQDSQNVLTYHVLLKSISNFEDTVIRGEKMQHNASMISINF